jgi:hypothetical protein
MVIDTDPEGSMRTFKLLLPLAIDVAVAQWAGWLDWLPDGVGLITVAALVVVALAYGLTHGPAKRAVTLCVLGLASLSVGILLITTGGVGARGLTVNEVAVAFGVALLILSATEAIRASRQAAENRSHEAEPKAT